MKGCRYLTDAGGCLHLVVPGVGSYEPTCAETDAYLNAYFGPCGIIDYGCGVLVDCGEDPWHG
ncbi:MAG: hypothetical protein V1774_10510 [Candidatus Eisenbacteria bacterium]